MGASLLPRPIAGDKPEPSVTIPTKEELMTKSNNNSKLNRRQFLKQSGSFALGAGVLAAAAPHGVFAAEDNTIRLALIGCGGRGTGAIANALSVPAAGPVKLYTMADLLDNKIEAAHRTLQDKFPDKVDVSARSQVPGLRRLQAQPIDTLRPGDVAMCTTRAYIRPVHVEYAIRKGINVFMEKPFAPDPGGLHRLLRPVDEAEKKNVKIAAGLQCRHSPARQALIEKIRNGELGDITLIRANRLGGADWLRPQGDKATELLSQLQFGRIHLFWVGSGHMVDNLIHQIDECCWIKDAWPVECHGMGGRAPNSDDCGQNIDVYSMEYTFADGTKAFCGFRRMKKTRSDFATYIHGTKCAAQFSGNIHAATVHMFKDQRIATRQHRLDAHQRRLQSVAVRVERLHRTASATIGRTTKLKRAVYSDLTALMGRAACHPGQTVTWDDMMASRFQFCDYLDTMNENSPVPVKPDANGRFPVPIPGEWKEV